MHHPLHYICTNNLLKISDKIIQNNVNHVIRADDRNRLNTFNVGDVKQLHASCANQFQILIKLNDNVYAINLSINVGISSTFNVEYLVNYKGLDVVDEPSHKPIFISFTTIRYFNLYSMSS